MSKPRIIYCFRAKWKETATEWYSCDTLEEAVKMRTDMFNGGYQLRSEVVSFQEVLHGSQD